MIIHGFYRESQYSPDQVLKEADTAILEMTFHELNKNGYETRLSQIERFPKNGTKYPKIVISMNQGISALNRLTEWKETGSLVINNPASILNCYRTNMVCKFAHLDIPFPETRILDIDSLDHAISWFDMDIIKRWGGCAWFKRGDVHATQEGDVVFFTEDNDPIAFINSFRNRGIKRLAMQQHIKGDILKFYSVSGDGFFKWYYADKRKGHNFSEGELRRIALKAANTLGLDIYGGDCVIREDGSIVIIDINDWPSFKMFKEDASKAIARFIINKIKDNER